MGFPIFIIIVIFQFCYFVCLFVDCVQGYISVIPVIQPSRILKSQNKSWLLNRHREHIIVCLAKLSCVSSALPSWHSNFQYMSLVYVPWDSVIDSSYYSVFHIIALAFTANTQRATLTVALLTILLCIYSNPISHLPMLRFYMNILTLKVLNFWKFTLKWSGSGWISDSYCSLKPLWLGMGEVVSGHTSPTLHPPSPPIVV